MFDTESSTAQSHRERTTGHTRIRTVVRWGQQATRRWRSHGVTLVIALCLLVQPVVAQSSGGSFCQTALAQTIMNLFGVIQLGGPLLGGLVALGATVSLPMVRRSDLKREIKEVRNQGILWGVIVAPLGTTIIQFLVNNVVAGAPSCSF